MNTRGFTLVETLVAITLVIIAVTAPLYAASHSMTVAESAHLKITASYLAQEAIEYVHRMRDNAYLTEYQIGGVGVSTRAWDRFLNAATSDPTSVSGCVPTDYCVFEPSVPTLISCPAGLCSGISTVLNIDPNGVYTHNPTALVSPFSRKITVQAVSATDELVTSQVTWMYHGTSYSVTLTDHLTPWQ